MRMFFVNRYREEELIGEAETKKECEKFMYDFLKEHNYKSYYTRISDNPEYLWYDVGSHIEFFKLYKDGKDVSISD